MTKKYLSYSEFWPFYVTEHQLKVTRIFHFIGTTALFPLLYGAIFYHLWFLWLMPLVAYGFAWTSHFFIEHNRPATFTYPLWSLVSDFKMTWFMLLGKMDDEVKRCEKLMANG